MIHSTPVALASYLSGGLLLAGALGVVLLRNMIQAAAALYVTLAMVAVIFFVLSADFLFAVQLFLYATITVIVVVVGILLTRSAQGPAASPFNRQVIAAAVVAAALFVLLAGVLLRTSWPTTDWPNLSRTDDLLAGGLLTQYAVPLVGMAVLLLAALTGAIVLAVPDEPRPRLTPVVPTGERGRRRRRRVRPPVRTEVKP